MTRRTLIFKSLVALALMPLMTGLFLAAITGAFALPNGPIVENVLKRGHIVEQRRANNGRVIDADTECIGLSVGIYFSDAPPPSAFKRAIAAESLYGCEPFFSWLETGQVNAYRDYFRYWHGYLVIARPILSVLPYNDLRGYLFTACLLLFGALIWRLGRDFGPRFALSFALPFLVVNSLGFWVVVTKAVTWFLIIGGALFMSRRKSPEPPLLAFFVLGGLTAFFDYFTTPALIFALPMLVFALYANRQNALEQPWRILVTVSGFFGAGYVGLWLAKFAIASAILDKNVWSDGWSAAFFRFRGASEHVATFLPGAAIFENFAALKLFWAPVALVLFIVLPFATRDRRARIASIWREGRIFVAIAAIPLLWLELLSNHSQIHAAYTQLNFAPAFILAGLILFGATDPLMRVMGEKDVDSSLQNVTP